MTDEAPKLPWAAPAEPTHEEVAQEFRDIVAALKQDFAYAVFHTAVLVRSNKTELQFIANTQRGQVIPKGTFKFTDGTTVELQDLGMCRPNVPEMTIQEILDKTLAAASELGLELG